MDASEIICLILCIISGLLSSLFIIQAFRERDWRKMFLIVCMITNVLAQICNLVGLFIAAANTTGKDSTLAWNILDFAGCLNLIIGLFVALFNVKILDVFASLDRLRVTKERVEMLRKFFIILWILCIIPHIMDVIAWAVWPDIPLIYGTVGNALVASWSVVAYVYDFLQAIYIIWIILLHRAKEVEVGDDTNVLFRSFYAQLGIFLICLNFSLDFIGGMVYFTGNSYLTLDIEPSIVLTALGGLHPLVLNYSYSNIKRIFREELGPSSTKAMSRNLSIRNGVIGFKTVAVGGVNPNQGSEIEG